VEGGGGCPLRPALQVLPSCLHNPLRVHALVSAVGFPRTSILFAFMHAGCDHVPLTSRTSQRLTNAYLTSVHSQSLQPCPPPPAVRCQYLPRRYYPLHWTSGVRLLVTAQGHAPAREPAAALLCEHRLGTQLVWPSLGTPPMGRSWRCQEVLFLPGGLISMGRSWRCQGVLFLLNQQRALDKLEPEAHPNGQGRFVNVE
jgi:hypothetical protein